MIILKNLLITLIAIQHIWFLILEMFLWTKPIGQRIFGLPQQLMQDSASLAANQGLYNGFLAAGLIWSLLHKNKTFSIQLQLFFLICILIAGVFGGFSASKKILFIQALPALVTLVILFISRK